MRRRSLMLLTVVLGAATACDESTAPRGDPINLEEGRGTLVSDPAEQVLSTAIWSPDGGMVYYLADSGASFRPRRAVTTGAGNTGLDLGGAAVAEAIGHPLLSFVAPAPTGEVYVIAHRDSTELRGVLRLVDGADPTWLPELDDPVAIALAPGGERLVYGIDLSPGFSQVDLWSYELASGTSTHLAFGNPLAFSPDGAALLYLLDDGTYEIAVLATGTTQTADLGIATGFPGAVRWTSEGPLVVFSLFDSDRPGENFYVRDVAAGTTALFYQESFDDDGNEVQALSLDGSKMALWFQTCLEGDVFSCDRFHSALYVIGVPDGSETWVAGARDHQVRLASFSPDAGKVAYVIEGQLYVSDLP